MDQLTYTQLRAIIKPLIIAILEDCYAYKSTSSLAEETQPTNIASYPCDSDNAVRLLAKVHGHRYAAWQMVSYGYIIAVLHPSIRELMLEVEDVGNCITRGTGHPLMEDVPIGNVGWEHGIAVKILDSVFN